VEGEKAVSLEQLRGPPPVRPWRSKSRGRMAKKIGDQNGRGKTQSHSPIVRHKRPSFGKPWSIDE